MDVNGMNQSSINLNVYNSDYSVSQYTNEDVSISEVKGDDNQASLDNNAKDQEYSKKELDQALNKINNFMKDDSIYAEYSYHKETKTTMIKLIDEKTKQVILEIPPKKILDMVASMCKQFGLFDRKA